MKRHFAIDEYGVYIKAGSILPFYDDTVNNLNGNDENIIVTVFPKGNGTFRMYEDAGNDKDYATSYAFTNLSSVWNGSEQVITISPREGSYKGMPSNRHFKVKVAGSAAPTAVTVNGEAASFSYNGYDFSFTVDIQNTDCSAEKIIRITYPATDTVIADGIVGLSRRIARSIEALKFRTGADPIDALAELGSVNEAVLYNPEKAMELTAAFMAGYANLPEILKQQPRIKDSDIEWFLGHCGWKL